MLSQLFRNGGFGMYPVLVLGLVGLATAAFFAARGDKRARGFLQQLVRSLVWAMIVATTLDFMAVFHYLTGEAVPAEQMTRTLYEGAFEALSPLPMGGAFLMLIYLLLAIGERRADARVPADVPARS